jgi:PAS domain S-box-containing protein
MTISRGSRRQGRTAGNSSLAPDASAIVAGTRLVGIDDRAHLVQFYDRDAFLLEEVTRFIEAGLGAGDAVVVIATKPHLDGLEEGLKVRCVDVAVAREQGRYAPLDAGEILARFMVDGSPDRTRFVDVVGSAIARAAKRFAHVRAFGELVTLLWAEGKREAALRLEELWNDLARTLPFSLLCAYPLAAFGHEGDGTPLLEICGQHSHVIPAESYTALPTADQRLGAIVRLQQKANALEAESAERARLAAIVESSDDAIIGKTLDGIITSWNPGAQRLFGYTAEEMIGRPISWIMPADCQDDFSTILEAIRRGERVEHYETKRRRKDGESIHVSLTVSPIRDGTGRIIGASKIARDVTERKRAEEALHHSREILDAINRVGQALSAELEPDKVIQAVTDAATSLTGAKFGAFFYNATGDQGSHYLLHALSGAPREAFEKFGAPRNTALFAATFAGERVVRLDDVKTDPRYGKNAPHHGMPHGHLPVTSYLAVPIVGRSGKVFAGLFLGHPEAGVFSEASEHVVAGLAAQAAIAIENARLYDAERHSRGEAEAANRAKDEFLAMLGHELRNPLSAVRNAVVTARFDPSRRERALDIVRRGTDQLGRLIDDLLDVARITQGRITLRTQRVRLASVVARAVETTQQLVEERAHRLSLLVLEDEMQVEADPTRLEQVIVNLITNAAKYTEPGGTIEVMVERHGGDAVLRVRDNGAGIAPDTLRQIFDLFTQADRGLDRAHGGLGIGLTVVRQLVELHGGRVEARSDGLGKGAEFVVHLPALSQAHEQAAPTAAQQQTFRYGCARVLVVEDNPDAAEGLVMLLEMLGHSVRAVHDGATALDLACVDMPDVMLVDIGLPGIDGYEVARRIRQDARLRHLALVALSGYGREEEKRRAIAAGFDYHLTKPVEPEALSRLVTALARSETKAHDIHAARATTPSV